MLASAAAGPGNSSAMATWTSPLFQQGQARHTTTGPQARRVHIPSPSSLSLVSPSSLTPLSLSRCSTTMANPTELHAVIAVVDLGKPRHRDWSRRPGFASLDLATPLRTRRTSPPGSRETSCPAPASASSRGGGHLCLDPSSRLDPAPA